jgi:type 1 glutamine amidotransferase
MRLRSIYRHPMKLRSLFLLFAGVAVTLVAAEKPRPIKALLITGGGYHDFTAQSKTLKDGLAARLNIDLTVLQEGTTREHKHSVYSNADWAKGYDVVIHNECFGMVADKEFVERVAAPHHAGVPAVILHASVHSFRNAPTDAWREVIGQRSMRHENRQDMLVTPLEPKNPLLHGFPASWLDPQDELYVIEKVWPGVTPLARGQGQQTKSEHVVVWTHTEGKIRAFVTTLGHFDATMKTDEYLDLVARGVLWAVGKLQDDGTPAPGCGKL